MKPQQETVAKSGHANICEYGGAQKDPSGSAAMTLNKYHITLAVK